MWTSAKAPSLAEMEAMAHDAFERLPKGFRDLCHGVILRVDDFPTDEVLDEMKAESEFDLLGLFQGVGLPFRSNDDIARLPNMVWLYRRPILDYWAEHDETRSAIISGCRMPIWKRSRRRSGISLPQSRHPRRFVMPGLVPGIHVLPVSKQERRG
jgi:predicted Zn-dependent protease with MMP-like domain